jgi:type I restriction enzyme R subunit
LVDKQNVTRNKVQVITQFEQKGSHANRYDVTILVNGLPLVQVELKKRGVAIREAFKMKDRLVFMDFITDREENVWPMVQAGKGLSEMLLGSEDL